MSPVVALGETIHVAYKLRPIQVEGSREVTYEHGKANHF